MDQALADFATVIEALSAKYNTTNTIVFGCSYIGSGAAWFRAKYPHLLAGAVASSPPVLAVADFYKYLDQVGLSISEQFGATCNANIAAGYKTLIDTLSSSPSSTVAPFNLCAPPSTALDRVRSAPCLLLSFTLSLSLGHVCEQRVGRSHGRGAVRL